MRPTSRHLLDPIDLPLPGLTDRLVGCRLLHLTDLHARSHRSPLDPLLHRLSAARLDLGLLTGDIQHRTADPAHAIDLLTRLTRTVSPRLGWFGVFGNHDSPAFRAAAEDLPIHWLINDTCTTPDGLLQILGLSPDADAGPADAVTLACRLADTAAPPTAGPPIRLLLCHHPEQLITATDLHADLVFCGHTHGGQIRLPGGRALHIGADLPLRMGSGLLRCRDTLCVLSRGIGHSQVRIRLFCPPQAPLCTLRKAPMPGTASQAITLIRRW